MATDLIMPTLNNQQTSYFFPERPQHHRSQSYQAGPRPGVSYSGYNGISSLSSSNSSGNSPTSPRPYLGGRQRPLFIPAALRPNEFPSKPVPVPKTSLSEDSTPVGSLTRSSTGFLSLAGSAVQRLTRRSTGDSGKVIDDSDDELDADLYPDVTGLPKRSHWKVRTSRPGWDSPPETLHPVPDTRANHQQPDRDSSICDDPTCKRVFGYFTRRHHCRRCGNIFCDIHSAVLVPLDENADYNPRGTPSRSCNHCHDKFQALKSRRESKASNSASLAEAAPPRPRPMPVGFGPGAGVMFQPTLAKSPGAAASVPSDWNWSTF